MVDEKKVLKKIRRFLKNLKFHDIFSRKSNLKNKIFKKKPISKNRKKFTSQNQLFSIWHRLALTFFSTKNVDDQMFSENFQKNPISKNRKKFTSQNQL